MSIVWSLEQRFQCNLNHSNRSSNEEDMTETSLLEKSRTDDVADFFLIKVDKLKGAIWSNGEVTIGGSFIFGLMLKRK